MITGVKSWSLHLRIKPGWAIFFVEFHQSSDICNLLMPNSICNTIFNFMIWTLNKQRYHSAMCATGLMWCIRLLNKSFVSATLNSFYMCSILTGSEGWSLSSTFPFGIPTSVRTVRRFYQQDKQNNKSEWLNSKLARQIHCCCLKKLIDISAYLHGNIVGCQAMNVNDCISLTLMKDNQISTQKAWAYKSVRKLKVHMKVSGWGF